MRLTWRRAALGIVALGLLGGAVVYSGVVPVAASSEHWAVTRWFLDFAMSRSVSTHSLGTTVPRLDDPAKVVQGAGHYEIACSVCHGRPGAGPSEVVRAMTPDPPTFEVFGQWESAHLFYIVRHGIKFTAMPEWPAEGRDDEVWAMVAFLELLPELDEESYLELAYGDAARDAMGATGGALLGPAVATVADSMEREAEEELEAATDDDSGPSSGDDGGGSDVADGVEAGGATGEAADVPEIGRIVEMTCARCHGAEGRGRGVGAAPVLAGQQEPYLERSLLAYASGARASGTMHPVASTLPEPALRSLARHFAGHGSGEDVLLSARPDRALADRIHEWLARAGDASGTGGDASGTDGEPAPPAEQAGGDGSGLQESGEVGPRGDEGPGTGPGDPVTRGEELARLGDVDQDIPACIACHGPVDRPRNPSYPVLAGQHERYLRIQLELFREGVRSTVEYGEVMHTMVREMTDEQIEAVAAYYASLGSGAVEP